IVAMAIFYIVSTGDEGMMSTAKSGIKAAMIGFAVMLSAWLIVNVILTLLVNTQFLSGIKKNGAFTFSCDTTSSAGTVIISTAGGGRSTAANSAGICGDGNQNTNEACDDGSTNNGTCPKSCDSTCQKNTCPDNGVCGTANAQSFSLAPTENLCETGTFSGLTVTGSDWTWTCAGKNSGVSSSCTAGKIVDVSGGERAPSVPYVMPASCRIIDVTWHSGLWTWGEYITPAQTMYAGQMFAFRLKTPPTPLATLSGGLAYAGALHYLNISTNPCEFTPAIEVAGCASFGMNEPRITYSTSGDSRASCHLKPNTSYYFNVKNARSMNDAVDCGGYDNCHYIFFW
ncbi:MAG: hypothetical protein WAV46_04905, partial [Candidatus Moraniibacteriota bacterium]